jgi:hypothetical protein
VAAPVPPADPHGAFAGTTDQTIEIDVGADTSAVHPEDAAPRASLLLADVASYASKRAQTAAGHSRPTL